MATMFPCPNCGGQLRFNVKRTRLICTSCGEPTNPYTYKPTDDINEKGVNTKIYTCPCCAGEIQLIDNDGMEFCPYCGNQATMEERFSTAGAPKYIMPFNLDKEDAQKKYIEKTAKIHFAPDGLKDKKNVEKLVGLYTPYYLYDYSIYDEVEYAGIHRYDSGSYEVTDLAKIKVKVDVQHLKVPFDASETLDDTIASELEPFPMGDLIDFNPNFLAGFFVENSSVNQDLYLEDSSDKAYDYVYKRVVAKAGEYTLKGGQETDIRQQIDGKLSYKGCEGAYLPLYFMTTRTNDRVSYSIINGASGETYIDMPIEKKKMFNWAVIASLVIFVAMLMLSFIFSFSYDVKGLCAFACLISSIIAFVGAKIANETYRFDNHLDDKGYYGTAENAKKHEIKPKKKKTFKTENLVGVLITIGIAVLIFAVFDFQFLLIIMSFLFRIFSLVLPPIIYIASGVLLVLSFIRIGHGKKLVTSLGVFSAIVSFVIHIMDLANDIYYYTALIVVFAVILISINAMVNEYNRFATHPSPQFGKKGGKLENAKN